ncbi:MAG: tRNA (adenosine(37)-N6)-dimethylallyltransferase MiaA [bacterium]|nr:tRNA (adenosine(37)-N6)-dimethylallyltransferase MiaA [bacterium]
MANRLPKLICIVGPTASGKTALAIKLAKKIRGEIISADSRQIYREMDIGTAKPPVVPPGKDGRGDVMSFGIPHYLIDIRNPNQIYTAGQFKRDAIKAVKQIIRSGKLPLLVGGTGLYISAIVNNLEIPEVEPNRQLRKKLEQQIQKHGLYYVYGKLTALDPEAAYNIDPKNPRRIIRAYEIALATKKPFSETRKKGERLFDILILGLNCGEKLKAKIAKRTSLMIKKGLVKETKNLIKKYGLRPVPFDAIGYRETIQYLQGKTTLSETITLINKNTWRFAKRQLTWFRKMPVIWLEGDVLRRAEKEIEKFLK